jgi:hypothetical protein
MVNPQPDNQLQFLLSDLGTRLRDIEERTSSLKERLNLINSNLIEIKENTDQRINLIEKQNSLLSSEIRKLSFNSQSLMSEMNNFVRKDEIILIERMLKDFQPLDFVRRKDLEEMKNEKQTSYEQPATEDKPKAQRIKTKETNI